MHSGCLHLGQQYLCWASQYKAEQAACQQVRISSADAGRSAWRLSAAQGRSQHRSRKEARPRQHTRKLASVRCNHGRICTLCCAHTTPASVKLWLQSGDAHVHQRLEALLKSPGHCYSCHNLQEAFHVPHELCNMKPMGDDGLATDRYRSMRTLQSLCCTYPSDASCSRAESLPGRGCALGRVCQHAGRL